jgi:hypothetical protein
MKYTIYSEKPKNFFEKLLNNQPDFSSKVSIEEDGIHFINKGRDQRVNWDLILSVNPSMIFDYSTKQLEGWTTFFIELSPELLASTLVDPGNPNEVIPFIFLPEDKKNGYLGTTEKYGVYINSQFGDENENFKKIPEKFNKSVKPIRPIMKTQSVEEYNTMMTDNFDEELAKDYVL